VRQVYPAPGVGGALGPSGGRVLWTVGSCERRSSIWAAGRDASWLSRPGGARVPRMVDWHRASGWLRQNWPERSRCCRPASTYISWTSSSQLGFGNDMRNGSRWRRLIIGLASRAGVSRRPAGLWTSYPLDETVATLGHRGVHLDGSRQRSHWTDAGVRPESTPDGLRSCHRASVRWPQRGVPDALRVRSLRSPLSYSGAMRGGRR
jgi:hypothetical protein